MAESLYLIRSMESARECVHDLLSDDWNQTTLAIHEDMINVALYQAIMKKAIEYSIQYYQCSFVEPDVIAFSVYTEKAGGVTASYRFRIESIEFSRKGHTAALRFEEKIVSRLGGDAVSRLVGGLAKTVMRKGSFLEFLLRSHEEFQVEGDLLIIDLDKVALFRKILKKEHQGRRLGRGLTVRFRTIADQCLCLECGWKKKKERPEERA